MKKRIIIRAPALSRSGYGEMARFALRSLKNYPEHFEIFLICTNWGRTNNLTDNYEEVQWIYDLVKKTQAAIQEKQSFDISIQITIPNEFEKIAPINIGYTAGIETSKIAPIWIEKSMLMEKIITISQHSKQVFNDTVYQAINNATGQQIEFRNNRPIDVIGLPCKNGNVSEIEIDLPCEYNFLSVVQWGTRKNLETTIKCFVEEFKNEEVGLVLKTNSVKNSILDRYITEKRILQVLSSIPGDRKCKIHLLHGNMTDEEMTALYKHPKIKSFISTSHGEGYGLPIFEAVCNAIPVAAPFWSGHVDFLKAPKKDKDTGKIRMRSHCTKIDFEIKQVQQEAVWNGVIQPDSNWCYVKNLSVRESMREMYKNYGSCLSEAKKLQEYILETFSEQKLYKQFAESIWGDNLNSALPSLSELTIV